MWPTVSSRLVIAVAILSLAFAAGWFANGWRLKSKHSAELVAMYEAGVQAVKKREAAAVEASARIAELERQKSKVRVIYRDAVRNNPECKAWSEQPIACPSSWQ